MPSPPVPEESGIRRGMTSEGDIFEDEDPRERRIAETQGPNCKLNGVTKKARDIVKSEQIEGEINLILF